MFFFILHICHIIVTRSGGPIGLKRNSYDLMFLQCFEFLTLLVGSFKPCEFVPVIVYSCTVTLEAQFSPVSQTVFNTDQPNSTHPHYGCFFTDFLSPVF